MNSDDFDLSTDAAALRKRVRQLAQRCIAPHSEEMDQAGQLAAPVLAELRREGLFGLGISPEYGGRGANLRTIAAVVEEIARVDSGVAVALDVHTLLASRTVERWAGAELRRTLLPAMALGRLGAFALSEDGAGSDAFALRTAATPVGGGFVLTGRKRWTSLATQAQVFIVFARTGEDRITAFLVDRDTEGLSVGPPNAQAGVRAACTAELVLDQAEVGEHQVLGVPGNGKAVAIDALTIGRIGIAAQLCGLADGALQSALEHADRREQFGGKLLSFQGVQLALGSMATDVTAARALVSWATRELEQSREPLARLRASAMAKQFAARTAHSVVNTALDIHGGIGYLRGTLIERLARDVRIGSIYEGTSTILLRTVASTLSERIPDCG